ncbi:exonuclease [Gordonia phage Catfish]|uniref:Exonuclease n=1 Tax=Gordonia phage Catfish TaxID=2301538 RepID=A0A385D1N3_9CAUD|nr:exonuclease [Gordonia phage Catfish]AXQ51880.1 exonuclease [Gordonia phage Catfish]
MTDYNVLRDRWDRPWVSQDGGPLIFPKNRKTPTNAIAYQRVSTVAGAMDDKSNLDTWHSAQAMVGVLREKSIAAQVGSLMSKHRDPWTEAKKQMRQLVDRALAAASTDDGSGKGTAFHEFTEVVDAGKWPEFVPVEFEPFLHAYAELMSDWEVIEIEPFLIVDELKLAGSMDKLLRHRRYGTIAASDLKSGKSDPDYIGKVEIQVACYAHGMKYDQATGERTPLHPDIDLDHGVLIHVPVRDSDPRRAASYPLDLARGWEAAKVARGVADYRKAERDRDAAEPLVSFGDLLEVDRPGVNARAFARSGR